jgi:hypothetical protein
VLSRTPSKTWLCHRNMRLRDTLRSQRAVTMWCCIILMLNCIIYIYKVDLVWVWSVWGVSIIRPIVTPTPTPTRKSSLRSQRVDIRVWNQFLLLAGLLYIYIKCFNTFIIPYRS